MINNGLCACKKEFAIRPQVLVYLGTGGARAFSDPEKLGKR